MPRRRAPRPPPSQAASRPTQKRSRVGLLRLVAFMFLASLVAVVLYSTMLRDVHGDPGQRSPRLRKLKSQRSRVGNDASNSVGNRSGDSPVVSNVDSLASSVNNKSSTGKKRWTRTVEMTDEQKAERRKALARSLLEQRARLAEEAKAAGRPPPSDDDWRKEGFAQKPSWWDRYQKVQRDQSAAVTAPNIAKGASQVDVMKAAAAAFKNWDGDDRFDSWDDDEDEDDDDDYYYGGSGSKKAKGKNVADPLNTIPSDCFVVMSKLCRLEKFGGDAVQCRKCTNNVGDLLKDSAGCRSRHFKDYCGRHVNKQEIR